MFIQNNLNKLIQISILKSYKVMAVLIWQLSWQKIGQSLLQEENDLLYMMNQRYTFWCWSQYSLPVVLHRCELMKLPRSIQEKIPPTIVHLDRVHLMLYKSETYATPPYMHISPFGIHINFYVAWHHGSWFYGKFSFKLWIISAWNVCKNEGSVNIDFFKRNLRMLMTKSS